MKRILILILAFVSAACYAQSFEEYRERLRRDFDTHAAQQKKNFNEYRARINKEYAEYMEKTWAQFDGSKPISIPEDEPKPLDPVTIPYIPDVTIEDAPDIIIPDEAIDLTIDYPAPMPVVPIEKPVVTFFDGVEVPFYGAKVKVGFSRKNLQRLEGLNEKQVSAFWTWMSGSNYESALYDLQKAREELDLCDWAFYQLIEKMSSIFYPGDKNAAALLTAYTLCQSGFKIRIGRDSNRGKLHILVSTDYSMLDRPYWSLNGERFFLLDDTAGSSLFIFDKGLEGEKPMRLKISGRNLFPESPTTERQVVSNVFPETRSAVRVNRNLIEFYENYPRIAIEWDSRTRWSFYLTELSEIAKSGLYPTLHKSIEGKSELEAVEILLNFIQTGFEYGYDSEIWGGDRAFFPEETLYYPYDDCEDRSVLFSRLVKDLVGLPVALIYYPGHLACAVRFNSDVTGDHIRINGEEFTVCDPTYINAHVGETMPDMDNSTAFAILL